MLRKKLKITRNLQKIDKTMKRPDHSSAICDQNQAKLHNQASMEQPTGINIEIHQQIKCIF